MIYNIIAIAFIILFALVIITLFYKRDEVKAFVARATRFIRRTFEEKPKAIYTPDQYPSQIELDLTLKHLAHAGASQSDINATLSEKNGDLTRREVAENMILYARNLSKG